jgi:hypothetical protein
MIKEILEKLNGAGRVVFHISSLKWVWNDNLSHWRSFRKEVEERGRL